MRVWKRGEENEQKDKQEEELVDEVGNFVKGSYKYESDVEFKIEEGI